MKDFEKKNFFKIKIISQDKSRFTSVLFRKYDETFLLIGKQLSYVKIGQRGKDLCLICLFIFFRPTLKIEEKDQI